MEEGGGRSGGGCLRVTDRAFAGMAGRQANREGIAGAREDYRKRNENEESVDRDEN